MKSDVVIIGGGIIGLYSAYKLARSGVNVTLLDKGDFGQESSWAAGGILTPLLPWDYDKEILLLTDDAATSYAALSAIIRTETGTDIEHWKCGLTILDHCDNNVLEWCNTHHVNFKSIREGQIEATHLPDISQVRAPRLLKGLLSYLKSIGVKLIPNTLVKKCQIFNNEIRGIETSSGVILTKQVIWSTGAWAPQLDSAEEKLQSPSITPIKGQIIALRGCPVKLSHILFKQGHYLIPRKDGLILAGSTLEQVGYENSVTELARNELWEKSIAILPELESSHVAYHWAGLRPGSPSNLPTIGPHPKVKGLFLNCGHYRYGIAMAPRSALIISKWIVESGRSLSDEEQAYSSYNL